MSVFPLTENKALQFHQAVLGLIVAHPNLLTRTAAELATIRSRSPEQISLWDRWAVVLELPAQEMAEVLLADTADGGLLRANSPFTGALSSEERNAIWRRIGLAQFMGHYLDAATDLALDVAEQAAITGIEIEELTTWQSHAPQEISAEALYLLKQIVALHKTLTGIAPDRDVRRRWLRCQSETLAATPIALLMDGKAAYVVESLSGAVQLTLGPDDLPRMGTL